jgi:hypothetical protein
LTWESEVREEKYFRSCLGLACVQSDIACFSATAALQTTKIPSQEEWVAATQVGGVIMEFLGR